MKHPLSIWSLFFCTFVLWVNMDSLEHKGWYSKILHLELCFQHQPLVTSHCLPLKTTPWPVQDELSALSPAHRQEMQVPRVWCWSQTPAVLLAMKPRICYGVTKYFLPAIQISFETRQHMEAYLVAAASACSVNLCQLTEITCLSPALKFT